MIGYIKPYWFDKISCRTDDRRQDNKVKQGWTTSQSKLDVSR